MKYINVNDLYQELTENPDLVIIDVRSEEEYRTAHVPRANLIPIDFIVTQPELAIDQILELMGDQKMLYVICLSDRRSFMACHKLAEHHFYNTCFVKEGTQGWINAGYPVMAGD